MRQTPLLKNLSESAHFQNSTRQAQDMNTHENIQAAHYTKRISRKKRVLPCCFEFFFFWGEGWGGGLNFHLRPTRSQLKSQPHTSNMPSQHQLHQTKKKQHVFHSIICYSIFLSPSDFKILLSNRSAHTLTHKAKSQQLRQIYNILRVLHYTENNIKHKIT